MENNWIYEYLIYRIAIELKIKNWEILCVSDIELAISNKDNDLYEKLKAYIEQYKLIEKKLEKQLQVTSDDLMKRDEFRKAIQSSIEELRSTK